MHVPAVEIGSLFRKPVISALTCSGSGERPYLLSCMGGCAHTYLCWGPKRGMHFWDRTIPVEVILVPEISLT